MKLYERFRICTKNNPFRLSERYVRLEHDVTVLSTCLFTAKQHL